MRLCEKYGEDEVENWSTAACPSTTDRRPAAPFAAATTIPYDFSPDRDDETA